MSITVLGISVDAVDAARLANFWAQALARTVDDGATEDFASIAADADSRRGPFLMFTRFPRARPSRTGRRASTTSSRSSRREQDPTVHVGRGGPNIDCTEAQHARAYLYRA